MDFSLLEKLINTQSPSGYEYNMQKMIKNEMKDKVDGFYTHASGAMVSYINKDSIKKVMLVAHCDEIGLMVTYIMSNGLIKVTNAGGIRAGTYVGQRIQILHEGKIVYGVIGADSSLLDHKVECSELQVDIGTTTYEDTAALVSVGDYAVLDEGIHDLANDCVAGRALDDRCGVFTILKAIEELKNETNVGVYASTTVGEETTGRGASFVPTLIKPDFSIIVDVTYSNDVYGKKEDAGEVNLGAGPVITHGSIINPTLLKMSQVVANEKNIPIQHEVWSGRTGTDGDFIFRFQDGIPTLLVSIPLRYMHSANEVASKKDLENTIILLKEIIKSYEQDDLNTVSSYKFNIID